MQLGVARSREGGLEPERGAKAAGVGAERGGRLKVGESDLTRSAEVGDGSRGTPSLTAASMVASFFWTTGRIATAWLVSNPASRSAADGSTGQLSSRSSM